MRNLLFVLSVTLCALAVRAGVEDVNLRDFPRLKGETDDAPRFRRAIAAAADGVLAVPKGEYEIGSMLHVTNRCSLEMHPNAHLKAVRPMDYVLFWDGHDDYHALSVFDGGTTLRDPAGAFIRGGDIDGRGLASCLALANAHHETLVGELPPYRARSDGAAGRRTRLFQKRRI